MRKFLTVFFIIGFLLALWSIKTLIFSPSANEINREQAAIAGWPSVSGQLLEIRLQQQKAGSKGAIWYYGRVRYAYRVDGIDYQGDRIGQSGNIDAYRDTDPKVLESKLSRFFSPVNVIKRETTETGLPVWNEETINLSLNDQAVNVYYDPVKPASSMLDPHDYQPVTTLGVCAPYLGLLVLGFFMMAVSVCVYRWNTMPSEEPPSHPGGSTITRRPGLRKAVNATHCENMDTKWPERQRTVDPSLQHGSYEEASKRETTAKPESSGTKEQREPVRKLVIKDIRTGSHTIAAGTYVWAFGASANDSTLIEWNDERFEVAAGSLVDTPVPAPIDTLKRLDPCFIDPRSMKQVYVDKTNVFRILECRHGNLFLEVTVTGIGWYSRLIFIGQIPRDVNAYREFWDYHKDLSSDELHLRGIGTNI
jgi:hypothetical protein